MANLRFILSCFLFAGIVFSSAMAQTQLGTQNGKISFASDAPLEIIKASSNEMRGKIDLTRKIFAFTIKTSSFQGFNSPLQKEHFNENYIESNRYPDATFSGKIIEDIDLAEDGENVVRAKGNLTIHGVTQERIIKIKMTTKNGVMNIKSEFTVLLEDHQIAIPRVVNEKLASEIKVEVKATLMP
ncbi:MAG: YceI family protein [Ferruginibacter sp.]